MTAHPHQSDRHFIRTREPFMPRDDDKNNDSRGRRDRPGGGKGRSGAARGPDKKFAKRGFAGKSDGDRPYGDKAYGKKPYSGSGKPYAGKRDGDAPRRDQADRPRRFERDDRPARGEGEKRPYTPRGDRPNYNRDDRAPRSDARPAGRFSDKKFGDKRPYTPREGSGEKRPYTPRGEGSERKFGGDKKFSRGAPDRGPRKDFGDHDRDRKGDPGNRGDSKPWQKRDASSPDHAGRNSRPPRDGARSFDRPRFDKPREDRGGDERPRFSGPREDRPHGDRPHGDRPFRERPKFDRPREDRPKFERPREGGSSWQEHPRSEPRSFDRNADRPRRDNDDDSKVFAKRPVFGGRGAYRERTPDFDKRAPRPPREKKSGERIAKVVSRAGLASRRDAEEGIVQGRVTVNGRVINSPALDVTANDVITVDGKPLPPRERTRLFMFHKPRGLMTTHADPEGRPTVFDNLPEGLPRLISIGRLDFNTEGLLLLTNDGGLARALELPDTGWLRRYRVRAYGEVTQAQLDELKKGVDVDGVKYGPIDAT